MESVPLMLILDGGVCTGMKCWELGLALGTARPRFIHLYSMMDKGKEEPSSSKIYFKFISLPAVYFYSFCCHGNIPAQAGLNDPQTLSNPTIP